MNSYVQLTPIDVLEGGGGNVQFECCDLKLLFSGEHLLAN